MRPSRCHVRPHRSGTGGLNHRTGFGTTKGMQMTKGRKRSRQSPQELLSRLSHGVRVGSGTAGVAQPSCSASSALEPRSGGTAAARGPAHATQHEWGRGGSAERCAGPSVLGSLLQLRLPLGFRLQVSALPFLKAPLLLLVLRLAEREESGATSISLIRSRTGRSDAWAN